MTGEVPCESTKTKPDAYLEIRKLKADSNMTSLSPHMVMCLSDPSLALRVDLYAPSDCGDVYTSHNAHRKTLSCISVGEKPQ